MISVWSVQVAVRVSRREVERRNGVRESMNFGNI
jgi:hypothetical protein